MIKPVSDQWEMPSYSQKNYTNRTEKSKSSQYHPWLIVRILNSSETHIVARFLNRQDAEEHLRALRRFIPNGVFEIVFNPPDRT
jgi:hypothetical protein